ncbi:MAG: 5-(carboxyamino)imidazole ribonucleotide mutase [Candidatus Eisenbacteria bacterium]|uniref:N5-carboxyaminoimidazole ribonucleotide mutase n=1 Tax=Eiseniibacteriota bacterium TaxID=2212470 RepID=A0A538SC19_UNCEI|nr:MAG: 5-(carboxyamino)imidazole ribonucleotide mutase [Candidatus Eisenbacteria bacterium]
MSEKARVLILFGSDSDRAVMEEAAKVLESFGVGSRLEIASAHRSPDRVRELVQEAKGAGIQVFIAGAGMANHLAGAVAAHTTLPVIGVPLGGSPLQGVDALYSTVQMPAGVPVATVAIGSAGAKNAAVLAVQMLALGDRGLALKLEDLKQRLARGERL